MFGFCGLPAGAHILDEGLSWLRSFSRLLSAPLEIIMCLSLPVLVTSLLHLIAYPTFLTLVEKRRWPLTQFSQGFALVLPGEYWDCADRNSGPH
jgi:hypothetical protein